MKNKILTVFVCIIIISANFTITSYSFAQNIGYEKKIVRLSEVLGSLHYLYNLCGDKTTMWRDKMNLLLKAENFDGSKKAKLTAAFNQGYQVFAENYYQCTPAALSAIKIYNVEGEKISQELIARFGN